MRTNKHTKASAFFLALMLMLSLLPVNVFAAEDGAALTIIHVNDRHGRTGAEAYIAQMVHDLEADGKNVLLLDAGDSVHGQTATNLTKGEAMVELMNTVGYDAMTAGNHEFNFGVDRLLELSNMMDFPLLGANVKTADGENLFEPYKIFEMDGLTAGVFGICTPETAFKADPRLVEGLIFEDPATVGTEMVEVLKAEGCDVIIALAHLGEVPSSAPSHKSDALAAVDGIDVIIDGHSHTLLENGRTVGDTLIAQTGEFGQYIGVVELTVDGGDIQKSAKVIPASEDSGLIADEAILEKIAQTDKELESITSVVVGNIPVELNGERSNVRTKETNLTNVITDSMLWATNADIAFLTGGNIRAGIDAGDVTMGEVLTVLPFSNLLVTVELSGADIFSMLEYGVSLYPEEATIFIHTAGLSFTFDPEAEIGQRIVSVLMADGSTLDEDKTYTVATIEFLAAGGSGYDMMANGKNLVYYGGDADALADYLATNPEIKSEPEGRAKIAEVDGETSESITSKPVSSYSVSSNSVSSEQSVSDQVTSDSVSSSESPKSSQTVENPKTGDNNLTYGIITLSAMSLGLILLIKRRNALK